VFNLVSVERKDLVNGITSCEAKANLLEFSL
jgi:hypothetical protein